MEPPDQEISEFCDVQQSRTINFEDPKSRKGRSGCGWQVRVRCVFCLSVCLSVRPFVCLFICASASPTPPDRTFCIFRSSIYRFYVTQNRGSVAQKLTTTHSCSLHLIERLIILDPKDPSINTFFCIEKRRSTGFEALEFRNVQSGMFFLFFSRCSFSAAFGSRTICFPRLYTSKQESEF